MNVVAFNGSPRKKWNTAVLLEKALEGAASEGASTQLVHLYDLNFKGCRSCFGCKMKGGASYGRCAAKDDLTPFLREVEAADAVLRGSPIYLWSVSGEMKSLLERLVFAFYRYAKADDLSPTLFPRKIRTGFIYTMNTDEEMLKESGGDRSIASNEMFLSRIFGTSESLLCFDTYQFDDYSKVDQERFDPAEKAARKAEHFPADCEKAFELRVRLVS